MIGAALGLAEGASSDIIVGEQGVYIIKVISKTEASDKKDYSSDRKQLASSQKYSQVNKLNNAIQELTEIDDERYKY